MEESSPPSNVEQVLAVLSEQATTIQRHDQTLSQIVQLLSFQSQASSPQEPQQSPDPQPRSTVTLLSEPRLPAPEWFDGSPERCRGFINHCTLAFQLQPSSFPTESSKVAYIITLLTGKALDWASALWDQKSPLTTNS